MKEGLSQARFHFHGSGSIWGDEGSADVFHGQQQRRFLPLNLDGSSRQTVPIVWAFRPADHTFRGRPAIDQTDKAFCRTLAFCTARDGARGESIRSAGTAAAICWQAGRRWQGGVLQNSGFAKEPPPKKMPQCPKSNPLHYFR